MSLQTGNYNDLATIPEEPPLFNMGVSQLPSNNNLSQRYFTEQTQSVDVMGVRQLTQPDPNYASDFVTDIASSQSTAYSLDSSVPTRSSSSVSHQLSQSSNTQPSPAGEHISYFTNSALVQPPGEQPYPVAETGFQLGYTPGTIAQSYQSPIDSQSDLLSFSLQHHRSAMVNPTRSPHRARLHSPPSAREMYAKPTPQLRKSRGQSYSSSVGQGHTQQSLSPGSQFDSPGHMDGSRENASPPMCDTFYQARLIDANGMDVLPEISAKIDKGFFMTDGDWTCYRRNYFQLTCSYSINPFVSMNSLRMESEGILYDVSGFGMTISAVVDGRDGRTVELVQHTPKRDKGPQLKPLIIDLLPIQAAAAGSMYPAPGLDASRPIFEGPFVASGQQPNVLPTEHTFERIQFKSATANNGKRRAAQQYYHVLVELHAKTSIPGDPSEPKFRKIARRISAPMVVRGRSPGHYTERRPSNAGSAGGSANNGGSYDHDGGRPGPGYDQSMGPYSGQGPVSRPYGGYSGYGVAPYDNRSHMHLPPAHASHIEIPIEPIMSSEEKDNIDNPNAYVYFPAPLQDAQQRSLPQIMAAPQKQLEYGQTSTSNHLPYQSFHGSNVLLPPLTATAGFDTSSHFVGRFEGVPSSRGYYPSHSFIAEMI